MADTKPLVTEAPLCQFKRKGNKIVCKNCGDSLPYINDNPTDNICSNPKSPSLLRKAVNFFNAARKHVMDGLNKCSVPEQTRRLAVCRRGSCGYYKPNGGCGGTESCAHPACGCSLPHKASWKSEDCPLGLWEKTIEWSYGVTTVPSRFDSVKRTLDSLKNGGFDQPRLFIDGCRYEDVPQWLQREYECTCRNPALLTAANWHLSAMELYLRNPWADYYAVFQDDIIVVSHLRDYLSSISFPKNGYLNLYTFPENHYEVVHKTDAFENGIIKGFYTSNQWGKSACALVFNNEGMRLLLSDNRLVNRHTDQQPSYRGGFKGQRSIDGAIVESMKLHDFKEYVHNPSLIQHVGDQSSMNNPQFQKAPTFPGEDFDARTLSTKKEPEKLSSAQPKRNRIGLCGFNCRMGLGTVNRQLATYADIDSWLVIKHPSRDLLDNHPDVDTTVCTGRDVEKIRKWVKSVDTILFVETPVASDLIPFAKEFNKRLVCIPMIEWTPRGAWTKDIDLFICPTDQCYDELSVEVPSVSFPWPVDINSFEFTKRETCNRFFFINGHGGWEGRKGLSVLIDALKIWPEMPVTIFSQKKNVPPHVQSMPNVKVIDEVEDQQYLYDSGDVLISPHSVDGIGLEVIEAAACGVPSISTLGEPWTQYPAIHRLESTVSTKRVKRDVKWYIPNATELANIAKSMLGRDISMESMAVRQWAEFNQWNVRGEEITNLVRTGQQIIKVPT